MTRPIISEAVPAPTKPSCPSCAGSLDRILTDGLGLALCRGCRSAIPVRVINDYIAWKAAAVPAPGGET